ncbi:exonuclease subunit SbcD [Dechloromonas sp. ZY10]|uniref:exonuclease subunit SbcD n=1 Tax=Dechloromonas aquae TaxID=2664436 RepID=UPI003526D2D7
MRLLHTSDWHFGQHFMGKSRQAEHAALIDWLLQQVDAEQIDAVIIAGDIFDTGTPPSYARELYHRLALGLADAGVGLLLLGGNHDSPAVLSESRELLERLGVITLPALTSGEDPNVAVKVLRQRDGQPGCVVCALPYIRPRDVLSSQAGQSAESKQESLQQAIAARYATVHAAARQKAEQLAAAIGRPLPLVATGHLTTVGASRSESVREIYVGSLDAFPTAAFPPVAYIALGHIHRPQRVGGLEHIRYSGSPLPLSFDEAGQQKEMLCVDLDAGGLRQVWPLAVPRFQPLQALRCSLAELPTALATAVGQADATGRLALPGPPPLWLEIAISGESGLADLPARVQAACAEWPVEVLRIRRLRETSSGIERMAQETLEELSPDEVLKRRLAQEELAPEQLAELQARYRIVVDQLTANAVD